MHLLLVRTGTPWSDEVSYNDNNEGRSVTSQEQEDGPNGGGERQDHHAVQLYCLQQHPGEGSQDEEMEHCGDKQAAFLSETQKGATWQEEEEKTEKWIVFFVLINNQVDKLGRCKLDSFFFIILANQCR